ncbi:uncharacterized protein LOC116842207 isoform X4 [Odontomachus brunneus]|uniref:uncharacterized protein LOC116842207 isoform X4 n=1 Tax=Odontomachus brunneus TaxID=486640 RepID=UPI0013F23827|nr:uncharacterized protein LOC116842207 isoform X4 [Odontomachus brunneus]
MLELATPKKLLHFNVHGHNISEVQIQAKLPQRSNRACSRGESVCDSGGGGCSIEGFDSGQAESARRIEIRTRPTLSRQGLDDEC